MLFERTTITSVDVMLNNTCPDQSKKNSANKEVFFNKNAFASLFCSGVNLSTVFCYISVRPFAACLHSGDFYLTICSVLYSLQKVALLWFLNKRFFDSFSIFMSLTGTVYPIETRTVYSGETAGLAVKATCFPTMWSTSSTILSRDGKCEPIGTQTLPVIIISLLGKLFWQLLS